ncbi:MAG: hypothetical protein O2V44_05375 [Candidatus Bathyarchaeota archaeon]|jgi:hypothetical protein|nr:hypothetical protein [Candidatus Bathyarchaeota archaeon]
MKKKILGVFISLLVVVMLAIPLIGAVQAGYGGKNKATFEWYVEQWPLRSENGPEDTKSHIIEKEDGTMMIYKNLHTYGEPPLVDDVSLPPSTPTPPWAPAYGDYPNGGIRLTVTPEGEDSYTLIGRFEKTMLYIAYNPKAGILENSKWSFTITAVEDGDAPDGAVGSTMCGTIKSWQGGSPMVIKSTKGTGIFEGAFLRGTHTTLVGGVIIPGPPPMQFVIFTWSTGSGEITFP